jgi:hypothetical protein
MPPVTRAPALDRRRFLRGAAVAGGLGAVALGAPGLLAACGTSGGGEDADRLTLSTDLGGSQLVGLFNYSGDYLEAGTPQRLAFAIATPEGPPAADGPETLTVQLSRDGSDVGEPLVLPRHADGTPIGYYPLVTTFDVDGTWSATTELDGAKATQSFAVEAAGGSPIKQVGDGMVPVDTPTTADARGVTPICTRTPQCPLHDVSLTSALAEQVPVALMISTPQYCQTGVCGPVLDLVMEQVGAFPSVRFVHAEVYRDPNNGADPAAAGLAPVVDAYGLSFEPSLFVARADGTIAARLDNVFDRVELAAALTAATS